ncbi:MAG: nucleotidyltransferase domain-containing protein [Telluria sp.]
MSRPGSRLPLLLQVLRQPESAARLGLAEWDLLLRQAASAALAATLRGLLEERGLLAQAPPEARAHFAWTQALAERHRLAVDWEVAQIRRALDGLALAPVLLKGAAYAMAGLDPSRGRMFSDIDIMVPKERLDEVEAALMMHGWVSTHHDEYDQRYYRTWMHELPPMQNVKRETLIDVHHAILPETARARPAPDKLRAAAVPVGGDPGLLMFAPADMVLHSAVHLFYDGEFNNGLRDLVDIHRLLGQFGAAPGFWERLCARAVELELARPLLYALRYSEKLLATPVPAGTSAALAPARPNPLLLALMDQLFLRALMPDHASCDSALTAPARFLLYVRGNWLRMPPMLLARHLFHKAFISPNV